MKVSNWIIAILIVWISFDIFWLVENQSVINSFCKYVEDENQYVQDEVKALQLLLKHLFLLQTEAEKEVTSDFEKLSEEKVEELHKLAPKYLNEVLCLILKRVQ